MKSYKLHTLFFTMAASAVVLTGCQNPDGTQNNTGSGALIGGVIGAIAGSAIGGPHHGGEGALIGAAAGAVGGGLIGNSMDQEQNARLRAQAPRTYEKVDQGQPLSVADVKALAKAGISEDVIINQIKNSRTVYHLSTADIIDLRDSGVGDKVINYMINTPTVCSAILRQWNSNLSWCNNRHRHRRWKPVVVAPGPDYVWIGGDWVWNGGWVWRAGYWGYPPRPGVIWVGGSWSRGPGGWHHAPGHWH